MKLIAASVLLLALYLFLSALVVVAAAYHAFQ